MSRYQCCCYDCQPTLGFDTDDGRNVFVFILVSLCGSFALPSESSKCDAFMEQSKCPVQTLGKSMLLSFTVVTRFPTNLEQGLQYLPNSKFVLAFSFLFRWHLWSVRLCSLPRNISSWTSAFLSSCEKATKDNRNFEHGQDLPISYPCTCVCQRQMMDCGKLNWPQSCRVCLD